VNDLKAVFSHWPSRENGLRENSASPIAAPPSWAEAFARRQDKEPSVSAHSIGPSDHGEYSDRQYLLTPSPSINKEACRSMINASPATRCWCVAADDEIDFVVVHHRL